MVASVQNQSSVKATVEQARELALLFAIGAAEIALEKALGAVAEALLQSDGSPAAIEEIKDFWEPDVIWELSLDALIQAYQSKALHKELAEIWTNRSPKTGQDEILSKLVTRFYERFHDRLTGFERLIDPSDSIKFTEGDIFGGEPVCRPAVPNQCQQAPAQAKTRIKGGEE